MAKENKENKENLIVEEGKPIDARPEDLQIVVMDIEEGMHVFDHGRRVLIEDKNYRMEIMKDFAPTIGDAEGNIIILLEDAEIKYLNVRCFYLVSENIMHLLITYKGPHD